MPLYIQGTHKHLANQENVFVCQSLMCLTWTSYQTDAFVIPFRLVFPVLPLGPNTIVLLLTALMNGWRTGYKSICRR